MRGIVRVLILTVLLASVLAACGPQQPSSPEEAAQKFLEAMASKDFAAAYKLLSPDSQATVKEEEFGAMIDSSWKEAKITAIQLKQVKDVIYSASGTRASVPYAISLTTEGDVTTDVYNALSLVQYNGQWGVVWPPVR
jgi:hypothetical protein